MKAHPPARGLRTRWLAAGAALLIFVGGGAFFLSTRDDDGAPRDRDRQAEPFSLVVDESLAPASTTIAGFRAGDPPRAVGRIAGDEGVMSDLVLGELVVSAADPAAFDAFRSRVDGTVVDRFEPEEPGDPTDYLVRVDIAKVDDANAAADLVRADPALSGAMRVSSVATRRLMALAARENRDGLEVSVNWVGDGSGFEEGTSTEVGIDDLGADAFRWPFLNSGSAQDTGVAAALSLLDEIGRLKDRVRIMVVDGGFFPNADFPIYRKTYNLAWGAEGRLKCKGNPCPWHGTQVVLAAMAALDNRFGTAGPAGPLAELLAVGAYEDKWKTFKETLRHVKDERPHVVNFSLGYGVQTFKGATEKLADRRLRAMTRAGALVVASAGNEGKDVDNSTSLGESILWLPCESKHVLCVGGMRHDSMFLDPGSSFGSDGDSRSVEIYAPFQTVGVKDPTKPFDKATKYVTGTSFSAPFVSGVAALVKAAKPNLSPDGIRKLLLDTAHVGGVHFDHVIPNEQQLRIDALGAVTQALGVTAKAPVVSITAPANGKSIAVGQPLELEGTAVDFSGRRLPISWSSSKEGSWTPKPTKGSIYRLELKAGEHVVTASAKDVRGVEGKAQITVKVVNTPPEVAIVAPVQGAKIYEGIGVDLIGWTKDPDTDTAMTDRAVTWRLLKSGNVVFEKTGHAVVVPGGDLAPGSYVARFTANDAGSVVAKERTFTIQQVPPGQTPPVAWIQSPQSGDTFYHQGGKPPPTIHLEGKGSDTEDGVISGMRYRWTAISEQGTSKTLCVGSNFPGTGGGGGFVAPKSCAEVDVQLGLDPKSVGSTTWAITLEVADSTGLISTDSVSVTVVFTVG